MALQKLVISILFTFLVAPTMILDSQIAFSHDHRGPKFDFSKLRFHQPDEKGPYNVGIRTFVNVPVFGPPLPSIQVFYPTLATANCQTEYTIAYTVPGVGVGNYQRTSPLCAVQDATPAQGAFPLVVHSHGGGAPGDDAQRISQLPVHETLASHGFVVVVPRHNGGAPPPAAPGSRRVRDLPLVIDYMLDADKNPLAASIDPNRIGLSGFSTGGRTSLGVTGGWASQGISADPRIKAMVLYEPGRDNSLEDVATISIPYLVMGGTRMENGTVIGPELFDTTVLATPRIYVTNPEAIHFNYQTDLCASIEETREAALETDDSLRDPVTDELLQEPLTNMIPHPSIPNLNTCKVMGAAGHYACTFWNRGETIAPLLPPNQAFAFGGGRNICDRIGVDSSESLDVDPVDGLTDDFVPGHPGTRLFEANDRFNYAGQDPEGDPAPIPMEEMVPMVQIYTVAFFKKFLADDWRYAWYLTPLYARIHDLSAEIEIVRD